VVVERRLEWGVESEVAERPSERVPSKIWILPSGSGMVYGIVPLFLLLLFFEDSLKYFLVRAIV
jgi:hypothetical protein